MEKVLRTVKDLEKEFKVKLVLNPEDFGIHKRVMFPIPYRKFETVRVEVVGPGFYQRFQEFCEITINSNQQTHQFYLGAARSEKENHG